MSENKKKLSIISCKDVLERRRKGKIYFSFKFFMDSKAPEKNIRGYDAWGYFYKEDDEWVITIAKDGRFIMGGGIGDVEKGFHRREFIKSIPSCVILMKKELVEAFKQGFKEFFDIIEFYHDGDLVSG